MMRFTRRWHRWFLFSLIIVSAACNPGPDHHDSPSSADPTHGRQTDTTVTGGVYRLPLLNNPSTLDPAGLQDQYGVSIIRQVFEGLVRFDAHLMVLPALAASWRVSDGGRAYRFTLRADARFHNGRPVTASDVRFSIGRLLKSDPPPTILPQLLKIKGARSFRQGQTDELVGFEEVDRWNFGLRLNEPYVPFLAALAMVQAAIVPEGVVSEKGADFGRAPVGSGPFQFVSWQPDRLIRLKRFDDYHDTVAFLDELHYRVYSGGQTDVILSDFKKGRLEEMPVFGDMRQELADFSDLQWHHRPSLSLFFYGMNCTHPHLTDPAVRRALLSSLQRDRIITDVYGGVYHLADSLLPPGMPGYDPAAIHGSNGGNGRAAAPGEAVIRKMKQLGPIELVSAIKTPRVLDELAIVRQSWSDLGIRLEFKFIQDWSRFETYLRSEDVQVFRYAWYADLPDPDGFLSPLFAANAPFNFAKYRNPAVDRWLDEARRIADPLERSAAYRRIQKQILESVPMIPLFYLSIDRVYQAGVRGIQLNPMAAALMPFARVWLAPAADIHPDPG